MHKSGTTLISQILHKSGINMGEFDESLGYDNGNQYERKESLKINNDMLCSHNKHCLDVINSPAIIDVNRKFSQEIKELLTTLNKEHQNWGFKDPRTSLTYPVWKKYLLEHKLIFIYRHPLEVWHHFQSLIPKYKIHTRILVGWKTLRAWYTYNLKITEQIREQDTPYIIINYNDFMNSSQAIKNLEAFIGINLVDCRRRDMYRLKLKFTLLYRALKTVYLLVSGNDIDALYLTL